MDVRLSIVIPTLGRPTLEATLASCADADEIVVVLDTAQGGSLPCELPSNVILHEGNFGVRGGHAGRAHGITLATGTHLAFFDDDDVYVPGAIDVMRDAACDLPVIFRIDHDAHGVIWRDPNIWFGNVTTQQYLVPNRPQLFGEWTPIRPDWPQPGGDCSFIKQTVENFVGVEWREEVIAVMRPDEERLAWYLPLPSITIVTPWMGHPELVEDYEEAVAPELRPGDEVLIVDNGDAPELPFKLLTPTRNLGFCGGSNLGLEHATADAVLFLNNDIALGRRGWLQEIRRALRPGHLVGPLRHDRHADVDGQPFPYIDGWCLAGMRDELLDLGGFPDLVEPGYYSDNLLCLEARAKGMTLREVRPRLRHKENTTAGPATDPRVRKASEANRARYIARVRDLCGAPA